MQEELNEAGVTPEGVPPFDPDPEYQMLCRAAILQIPQTQDGVPLYAGMLLWSLETNLQYRVSEVTQKPAGVVRVVGWPTENGGIIGTRQKLDPKRLYAMEHKMWDAIRENA